MTLGLFHFLPEICHNTVSQRATTYDDNVVFTFKDRKEVTIQGII